jgi:[FeFe] hydrogenase H-cluster maturation GTPase HydF
MELTQKVGIDVIEFSCNEFDEKKLDDSITLLVSLMIKSLVDSPYAPKTIFDGIVDKGDNILLVCPIDSEAPEGRLILPQVNAIRDILDKGAVATVVQPENLSSLESMDGFTRYKLVVTDSQAFDYVSQIIPKDVNLTGFSILLARSKGFFNYYLDGTKVIDSLKEGDKILILESCTHHTSCDDIGRIKIPKLLKSKSGCSNLDFTFITGLDPLPHNLNEYSFAIQCGGCMVTNRQLSSRIKRLIQEEVPVSNYGMTLAYCMGIFDRSVSLFK